MEAENGVTRSISNEFHSWDIQRDQMDGESMVFLEVSSMNLILGMCMEIIWKVNVVLLEVPLMNFICRISKEIKQKVKGVLLEVLPINFIVGISRDIEW